MKQFLLALAIFSYVVGIAQPGQAPKDTTWKAIYRSSVEKVNDLVHTKLECNFDFEKAYMNGKVWVTLQPHFYATNTTVLDAKGMEIKEVALVTGAAKKKLTFEYDGLLLKVNLGKTFNGGEKYTLYIDYVSKPDEFTVEGSEAITDAKGLYFINPRGEEPNKPTSIWTQGETHGTSVWCPTIDNPGQKTTNEFYITVPAKYVSLSNGLKLSEKKNANGTRTDYWKMDMPHAPYLFFMGVGEFAIIKDKPYKGKEVSYYVEKEQAQYAKGVFGNTPEMLQFFSTKLGVDFPWQKYAQIVGRDYVSGAMENTTATIHQENAYQNTRQLADGNSWEETIAHELFHQWFGDLVTAESWSNLTVNESFANYSEYLWDEYKYGKDFADAHNYQDMQGYLFGGNENKHLVRFNYSGEMDMFDGVSYNKGGRILHMLRKYVGDDAFFKSLQNYLTTNKFKTGEAHQLRLAFEEVTGKDLNWFFNQWYFGAGHPEFTVSNSYDEATKQLMVVVAQTQKANKVWQIPVDIDVYANNVKTRNTVWLKNKVDTLYFDYATKPSFVDFDGDRTLLCVKKETKTAEEYAMQYEKNTNYLARREAIDYFAKNKITDKLLLTLKDKFSGLRTYALGKIGALTDKDAYIKAIAALATTEKDNKTKAAALKILAKLKDVQYSNLFKNNVGAVSYNVAGAALEGLIALNPNDAYTEAKKYVSDAQGALGVAVSNAIIEKGSETDFEFLNEKMVNAPLSESSFTIIQNFANYLSKIKNIGLVKKGLDAVSAFRKKIPAQFLSQVDPAIKGMLAPAGKAHGAEVETYIEDMFK